MALPKLTVPYYKTKLPSTGEEIKYRPFLVKEEKILMLAMESGDDDEMSEALTQIIKNCTDEKVDPTTAPLFDIEYLFLQLRIKSVEEKTEVMLRCSNKNCNMNTKAKIDLSSIKVKNLRKKQDFNVQLTDSVGVKLSYPTLDITKTEMPEKNKTGFLFDFVTKCIVNIYDEDQIYKASETTREDMVDFLESLTTEQFEKITDFFDNIPKLEHSFKFKCPHCKQEQTIVLSGLKDFFSYASPTTP